jgi:hypothetical protein
VDPRRIVARFQARVAAEIPLVIKQVRMVPQTDMICPHCKTAIHEKGFWYDGENYFHRAATCAGKPMRMPPAENVPDYLKPYME